MIESRDNGNGLVVISMETGPIVVGFITELKPNNVAETATLDLSDKKS